MGGLGRGGQQFIQAHSRNHARRRVNAVILPDERRGIYVHDLGDGADVPPCVEVTPTGGVIVVLDSRMLRFP